MLPVTSITATASSGTLRGDTDISVSEDYAPTQFGLTLTNEDALAEEEVVVVEISVFSPNGNVDVYAAGVLGIDLVISPSEKDVTLGEITDAGSLVKIRHISPFAHE